MRDVQELRFTTHDGVELFYRHWPASRPAPDGTRQAVLLFHRGHEHSGRIAHLVDELDLPEHDFFAWDARGHGLSPGARGDSPSFATSVRDVQTFVDHIQAVHGIAEERMAVVAQSVGAVLVSTWAHDYAPKVRALVLASPAFQVKLYVPFARSGLKLMRLWRGNFFVNSYVKARFLSHDPQRIASYDSDPLIAKAISVNVLLGLYEAAERVVADAQAIQIPTQLLISGADFVVHRAPQERFFERLGSLRKEKHILPGFFHDTLGERDRHLAVGRARRFLLEAFATAPNDRACSMPTAWAIPAPRPRRWPRRCRRTRRAISTGAPPVPACAWAACGRMGSSWASTPASIPAAPSTTSTATSPAAAPTGSPDRPQLPGLHRLARHPPAQAARRELLRLAMQRLREEQREVRIVDIAAGHGRYILEALQGVEPLPESILLRDYSEINVRDGSALIESKGLAGIARFVKGDAFDRADLAALQPKPSLGVVSGLYELFADNRMVGDSLAGLGEALEEGGYLVYTGQPWHPQLELIARALTSHRQGQAWVMRRRTQAEMDQLVAAAGFRKITQRVDQWGIFSVSLAQKVAR